MGPSDKSKDAIEEDLAALLRTARLEAERVGRTGPDIRPLPASQLEEPIDVPADESNPAMAPPDVSGFKISREIGSGGQATVFEATQNSTGQKVAIKVMPGGRLVGARRRERFDREARVLAALTHPNVVGIIDRGSTADGSLYLVMDYIDGRPLDEYAIAVRADALPDATTRLLRIFVTICDAVADAHGKGIIHRDLKPSNIRVDRGGEPHVLDFGLARVLGPETLASGVTLSGQVLGSLPWASPEQVSGGSSEVNARSDVYSLGVMLYQLLTGHFPYSVSGPIPQVADHILHSQPKPPTQVPGASDKNHNPELDAIVLKALAKVPDARFATAGELGQVLTLWLRRDPQPHRKPRKVPTRYRPVAVVTLCVMCVLVAARGRRWWPVAAAVPAAHGIVSAASTLPGGVTSPANIIKLTIGPTAGSIITNSLGMHLAFIPPGEFMMGSLTTEVPRNNDEDLHKVILTKPFYMGVTTVTRDQYSRLMGIAPGDKAPGDAPVTYVTWEDAHQFCQKLSEIDHRHYRLPTEAEWEYACRAGTTSMIAGTGALDDMGWYMNRSKGPMPVGRLTPNAWGLYDMHGNVCQWCEDHYRGTYPVGPVTDPFMGDPTLFIVARGGDFTGDLKSCRSAMRFTRRATSQTKGLGFRVVMDISTPPTAANDPIAR